MRAARGSSGSASGAATGAAGAALLLVFGAVFTGGCSRAVLCGGRGRLTVYRLAVHGLGLRFGRGTALYLGDDRLKVEITGIRNVVQQILELVQIKFIFLIHDVTSFICLVSQTAAERFEQQDRCGIGGVE